METRRVPRAKTVHSTFVKSLIHLQHVSRMKGGTGGGGWRDAFKTYRQVILLVA